MMHFFEIINGIHAALLDPTRGAAHAAGEIALAYQFIEQAAYDQGGNGGFDLAIAGPLRLAEELCPEDYRGKRGDRVYGRLPPLGLATDIGAALKEKKSFETERNERRKGKKGKKDDKDEP